MKLLLAFAAFSLATAAQAAEVTLRDAPSAHGAKITLGDLFDGAGAGASVAVAPAPAAGGQAVLDASAVQSAAKRAGLDWANAEGRRRIMVAASAEVGAGRAAAKGKHAQALAYARNINAGEIVSASDLVWSDEAVASADALSDADAAIGKAAKRPLRQGSAVAAHDLGAPRVIKRDEIVQVAFEDGGISLSMQAKALSDAGVGDLIQLLNLTSKKTLEAVASGPGRAVVGPAADILKAQAINPALRLAAR